MIVKKHNLIFIHIFKNAGKSVERFFKWDNRGIPKHKTVKKYIKEIGEQKYNKLNSFTIIRNPWDRIVSLYFYYRKVGKFQAPKFDNFNDWMYEIFHTLAKKVRVTNQIDWLTNKEGKLSINSILRFENLEQEWYNFCIKYNISYKKLPVINKSRKRNPNYRVYYNDYSKKIIEDNFTRDIDKFKYEY